MARMSNFTQPTTEANMKMTLTKSLLILVFTSSSACGFLDEDIWVDEIAFEESIATSGYTAFGISSCGGYKLYRRASVTSLDPMIIRIPIRKMASIDSSAENTSANQTHNSNANIVSSPPRDETPDWLFPFVEASALKFKP